MEFKPLTTTKRIIDYVRDNPASSTYEIALALGIKTGIVNSTLTISNNRRGTVTKKGGVWYADD